MKKGFLIFNIVLSIAVVILFVLVLCGRSSCTNGSVSVPVGDSLSVDKGIAYINTDSLLAKYEYAKHLNEDLLKKEEKSRTDFNEKVKVFQQDATEFQRKVQNNGFLSLERAKQEEQRLAQIERDLQDLNSRLSNQLMMEQSTVSSQLRDSLVNYLKLIQSNKNFKIVLSNSMGDNVLYSVPGVDITNEVVEGLNARYNSDKK